MKKAIVALSICIAAAPLAVLAQGEVGAVKQPPPVSKASPDDKAAGKAMRKSEGRAAAKTPTPGEVGPMKGQQPMGATSAGSTESRAEVKAEAKAANKAGEADKGGLVGPTK